MGKLGNVLGRAVTGPLKAILPKNPWFRFALIAIPILIVLALLEPVLSLFEKGLDVVMRLLSPLLETPIGRLLLLNAILLLLCVVVFWIVRSRVRQLRSGLVLRRHLDAIGALVSDQPRKARDLFRRVARSRSIPPAEFPAIQEDAKLKLARLALEEGSIDDAVQWLTRTRDKDLPKELRRSLAQLRGMAFVEQGEIDPETLAKELRAAVQSFGPDPIMLGMLRDLARQRGDWSAAVAHQEQLVKNATPRRLAIERQQLVRDLLEAGDASLAQQPPDPEAARGFAKRAQKLAPDSDGPAVLLGRVHLAWGDARAAVRAWGKSRSPAGLQQIARLLDDQPGVLEPREILEACPMQGAVLLVAREYARAGDLVRAERAARAAANKLGPTPSVAAVLAEVLERCGRPAEAEQLTTEAVRRLASS